MANLNIEVSNSALERLQAMAQAMDVPVSEVIENLVESPFELNAEQMRLVDEGIADADAGRFASEEEMQALFAKY